MSFGLVLVLYPVLEVTFSLAHLKTPFLCFEVELKPFLVAQFVHTLSIALCILHTDFIYLTCLPSVRSQEGTLPRLGR